MCGVERVYVCLFCIRYSVEMIRMNGCVYYVLESIFERYTYGWVCLSCVRHGYSVEMIYVSGCVYYVLDMSIFERYMYGCVCVYYVWI